MSSRVCVLVRVSACGCECGCTCLRVSVCGCVFVGVRACLWVCVGSVHVEGGDLRYSCTFPEWKDTNATPLKLYLLRWSAVMESSTVHCPTSIWNWFYAQLKHFLKFTTIDIIICLLKGKHVTVAAFTTSIVKGSIPWNHQCLLLPIINENSVVRLEKASIST